MSGNAVQQEPPFLEAARADLQDRLQAVPFEGALAILQEARKDHYYRLDTGPGNTGFTLVFAGGLTLEVFYEKKPDPHAPDDSQESGWRVQ